MNDQKQWKKHSVMMVGLNKERIMQGLAVLETQEKDTLTIM